MAGVEFKITLESAGILKRIAGLGDKARWKRILRSVVAIFGHKDVIDHFEKEQGPDGKWPPLNEAYAKWKKRHGKTKKLVLSGNLRQSFLPSNIRDGGELAVAYFNPVEYGGKHDRGEGVPERKFMWLSDNAKNLMDQALVDRIVRGDA